MARIAWLLPLVVVSCSQAPTGTHSYSNGFKLPDPPEDATWVTRNGGPTRAVQEPVWIGVGDGHTATIWFPNSTEMGILAGGILLLSDAMVQSRTVRAPVAFAHPDPEITPEFQVNTFYYRLPVPANGILQVDFLEGNKIRGHVKLLSETLTFESIPRFSCSPKIPDTIDETWDPYATEYCQQFRWLIGDVPASKPLGPDEDVIINMPGACGGVDYRRTCGAPPTSSTGPDHTGP